MNEQGSTATGPPPFAIKFPGPGLGEVAVGDVAEFLRAVVDLVAFAAASKIARPVGLPGRRSGPVEEASKVRLVALSSGSLIADLAPATTPEPGDSLGLDAGSLSEAALGALFDAVHGWNHDPDVASALVDFAERMTVRRPNAPVTFVDRRGEHEVEQPIDDRVLGRLRATRVVASSDDKRVERVVGRLYEANVESDEAHVRTSRGDVVKVTYDESLEPEIKRLLGDRAALVGEVEYDPRTNRVRQVRVQRVDAGVQLQFEGVDFWTDPDLADLAAAVAAKPVSDPDDLHVEADDAEWDELYRVLRSAG